MKPVHFVLFIALMFIIGSCSSDDDGPLLSLEEVLPGTWVFVEAVSEFDTDLFGITTSTTIMEGTDFVGQNTFSEDPNVWESNIGMTLNFTVFVNVTGETETQEFSEILEQLERSGTWMINEEGQLEGYDYVSTTGEEVDYEPTGNMNLEVVNNNRIVITDEFEHMETDPATGLQTSLIGYSRSVMERK
jgi:hypothetical protein